MKDHFKVEELSDDIYLLAESPFYDSRSKVISWVDILGAKLYLLDNHGKKKVVEFSEKIGAAVPLKRSYGYLVCGETKLFLYENNQIKELKNLDRIVDSTKRCNDAKADPFGRLWFSTIVDDGIHAPSSSLYVYANREIICQDDDLKLGNGMAWSKDGTKFFFADSANHAVYEYDYDVNTGYISNKKELFKVYDGAPDGMAIDYNDNLFVAIYGGSRIEVRSSKTGILKKTINIPAKLVTSCCFIGDDYNELFITTSSIGEYDKFAGRIFKCKLDYKGKEPDLAKID